MNTVTPTPTTMTTITSENIQKIINIWQSISYLDGNEKTIDNVSVFNAH